MQMRYSPCHVDLEGTSRGPPEIHPWLPHVSRLCRRKSKDQDNICLGVRSVGQNPCLPRNQYSFGGGGSSLPRPRYDWGSRIQCWSQVKAQWGISWNQARNMHMFRVGSLLQFDLCDMSSRNHNQTDKTTTHIDFDSGLGTLRCVVQSFVVLRSGFNGRRCGETIFK